MNQQLTVEGSDALLWPFLRAQDRSLAERLLTDLIQQHADPNELIRLAIVRTLLRIIEVWPLIFRPSAP